MEQIDGLELCGRPDMCVVAFKASSRQLNIYKVNDLMTNKGWHLNALQFPPAAANAVILLVVTLAIIAALTRVVDVRKEL